MSICGLYRTGKSYLLNLLLGRVQQGKALFKIGGTTQACTEGIWVWGAVDDNDDKTVLLFFDCEGFGSTDSDRTRDAQLMTLCMIMSSVLVLNTKGVLNENLFGSLALVCHFADHMEEKGREANRPALLWVLRDFVLELRDANGHQTTPGEYLEQALSSAPTTSDASRSAGAREVRLALQKTFPERSCATLVQPVIEEAQLQRLESVPYDQLRREFREQVEALRTQIFKTARTLR